MLQHIKNTLNRTLTENGAATYRSTESYCLDLFSSIGALRGASAYEINTRFRRAYAENPDIAMKILFHARDIRGGLGERRVFRTILKSLALTNPASVRKNIPFIAEYGRFDDLLTLLDTPCEKSVIAFIKTQLEADIGALENDEPVSLLAKWLPSVNATNAETVANAKKIARALHISDAEYRKMLTKLRARIRIIENNLRERDYTFDYEAQPSKAMYKYRKAFLRNDSSRYHEFLARVQNGSAKMHTGTLYPYDVISPLIGRHYLDFFGAYSISEMEREAMNTTWNALENFTDDENALVIMDGSGSMYNSYYKPAPITVALSLAVYFAERNTGAFKNHFITFSETPRLVEIMGQDIVEKVTFCERFNEVANTNVSAVFNLILKTAVQNSLPQEELPSTLYFISDMEFDRCAQNASLTNFEAAKRQFARYGYKLPRVVFWNVASREEQHPVTKNEQGVALVSGASPRIFQMLRGQEGTPYTVMMEIIGGERYEKITA